MTFSQFLAGLVVLGSGVVVAEDAMNARRPESDRELRYWLENMVVHHKFSDGEVRRATGLTEEELAAAKDRLRIGGSNPLSGPGKDSIFLLPYPGGRHPRIGFLEGAIDPQRETKVSVWTPWQPEDASRADYVIVDVPEAVWSNLGLTYLAHTHVPTIWSAQNITLDPLEWTRTVDGGLSLTRELPNGITFSTSVAAKSDHVAMTMSLTNGTAALLTGLRVQMCVMLKEAAGFEAQTNENKVLQAPYSAVHDSAGKRWIITAWKPNQRTWANQRCPCLHSDPQFPDCEPGATEHIVGWLSFYDGTDIEAELSRIEGLKWWRDRE